MEADAGSVRLHSATAGSATWTEHLRCSRRQLEQRPANAAQTSSHIHGGSRAAEMLAAALGPSTAAAPSRWLLTASTAGVTAGIAASTQHSGCGYGMHPAAADSMLHTGAVNPAAPQDGKTRVPALLDALHIGNTDDRQQVTEDRLTQRSFN